MQGVKKLEYEQRSLHSFNYISWFKGPRGHELFVEPPPSPSGPDLQPSAPILSGK